MPEAAIAAAYKTPANAPNNRQEMRPLPLRVARSQYDRLVNARDRTGISIQEHVRRGIDAYLATIEREAIELGHMPPKALKPTTAKPKVVKR
jgi:hypothetical protein